MLRFRPFFHPKITICTWKGLATDLQEDVKPTLAYCMLADPPTFEIDIDFDDDNDADPVLIQQGNLGPHSPGGRSPQGRLLRVEVGSGACRLL